MASLSVPLRRIGISLGNIDRFVDGLGEFSREFGLALASLAPQLREEERLELVFHTVPALFGCFGNEVAYMPVRRVQEWRHRSTYRFALWHTLNQLNRYPAPSGTPARLLTVHDLNFMHVKSGYSRWRDERRLRRLLSRQTHLSSISTFVAEDLQRLLGSTRRVTVIPNGVRDLTREAQQPVPGLVGQRFFLHISRMVPSKNVEALLAMMAEWPDRRLVLAGPSARRNEELRRQGRALGIRQLEVLTMVSTAQKAWLYANCEAFFFPSLSEGFGLPPLEAMHFGKPVFLSTLTSLPEVGADAAYYWSDFDPGAMRSAVEHVLAGFDDKAAMRARQRAQQFTWTRAARSYVELYRQILIG